ncbi:3-methyladenine DNA glycosylase [Campylobacter iguaniorum]|uniref:3-methyladenine DNA glycosylase n=1 Tax=Campylobacter iguaniorum TaxID=1244531 RepID=UPI003AADE2D2
MSLRSEDLFLTLSDEVKFDFSQNPFWWPEFGTFWVVIGAILTQNTKWQNVKKALDNLQNANVNCLEDIANLDELSLAELIKPSGFYNTKAKRLSNLAKNIISKFESFDEFKKQVSRKWLIAQKGLGLESVDSILCYACEREIMVVDNYTLKIFEFLNYSFDSYDEAREWLESIDRDAIYAKFGAISDNEIFAKFHGLIVEFCKAHLKGKVFDDVAASLLKKLS